MIDVFVDFVGNKPLAPMPTKRFRFWEFSEVEWGFCIWLSIGYLELIIRKDGTAIRVAHSPESPFLEVMRYLTGLAFGAILRFKGVLCLHASAISIDGSALVFVGPSRTGKSTLSAAFHQRGYSLVSEDIVGIDQNQEKAYVRSGYGGVRLFQDSLNHFYDTSSLDIALAVEEKFLYQLPEEIFIQSHSIRTLYILAPRNPNLQHPQITPISHVDSLLLLTDQFYLHRYDEHNWLERDFPRLGQLIEKTPIYVLERTNNLDDLDATIDMLVEHSYANNYESPALYPTIG